VAVEALCICSACPPFRPKLIAFGHDGYQSELACIACFVLIRPIEQAITFLELSLCASSCASTFDMALIHGIGRTSQHDEVPYTMLSSILSRDLFSASLRVLRMLRWKTSDGFDPLHLEHPCSRSISATASWYYRLSKHYRKFLNRISRTEPVKTLTAVDTESDMRKPRIVPAFFIFRVSVASFPQFRRKAHPRVNARFGK